MSVQTADVRQQTELTLQDIPKPKYQLRLFVENEGIKLQRKDSRTWAPAQRPYVPFIPTTYTHRRVCVCRDVSPTSEIRAEIRMTSGHGPWAKIGQAGGVIDLQDVFNRYWSTNEREFTVPS